MARAATHSKGALLSGVQPQGMTAKRGKNTVSILRLPKNKRNPLDVLAKKCYIEVRIEASDRPGTVTL